MNTIQLHKHLCVAVIALMASTFHVEAQEISVGSYRFRDGGEYSGELFRGKPWGKGKTTYKNGDYYEGEYEKGKRHLYPEPKLNHQEPAPVSFGPEHAQL